MDRARRHAHATAPAGTLFAMNEQQGPGTGRTQEFVLDGDQVVAKVRELIHEGNIRRITIKNDEGRTMLEVPLTLGLIGAALLPVLAAIGAAAALATRCTIVVERDPVAGSAPTGAPSDAEGERPA
jgi:hypothetical protein